MNICYSVLENFVCSRTHMCNREHTILLCVHEHSFETLCVREYKMLLCVFEYFLIMVNLYSIVYHSYGIIVY